MSGGSLKLLGVGVVGEKASGTGFVRNGVGWRVAALILRCTRYITAVQLLSRQCHEKNSEKSFLMTYGM